MGSSFVIWFCVATAFLVLAVKIFMVKRSRENHHLGFVANLVRRDFNDIAISDLIFGGFRLDDCFFIL